MGSILTAVCFYRVWLNHEPEEVSLITSKTWGTDTDIDQVRDWLSRNHLEFQRICLDPLDLGDIIDGESVFDLAKVDRKSVTCYLRCVVDGQRKSLVTIEQLHSYYFFDVRDKLIGTHWVRATTGL